KPKKEKFASFDCQSDSNSHDGLPRSLAKPMMRGNSPSTNQGWTTLSLVTVGEKSATGFNFNPENFNYNPVGVFDGIGTFVVNNGTLRTFINHEVVAGRGLPYILANGTVLTGARIDTWDISRKDITVKKGALAYDTIIDREGIPVTNAQQLNKGR